MNKYDLSAIPDLRINSDSPLVKSSNGLIFRDFGGKISILDNNSKNEFSICEDDAFRLALWILKRFEP